MGSNESSASKKGTRRLAQGRGEQMRGVGWGPTATGCPTPAGLGAAFTAHGPAWVTDHTGEGETRMQQCLP